MQSSIEIKNHLHHLIDNIQDTSILHAVFTLLQKESLDEQQSNLEDEPDMGLRMSLSRALEQSEKNQGIPHEVIWPQLNKKYIQ